ncbi:hypothetical protein L218DRAFT_1005351 [Marasmius fiardii PR-910]|nr:hypothetical protein L218DRAFT_1005351 [Marasmius fiardii PR-910]
MSLSGGSLLISFQSELDYYVQESSTTFRMELDFILQWFPVDTKFLQYSRLMRLIHFHFWILFQVNKLFVLDWLKTFPPAYSELVQSHIDEVTRMISTWQEKLEEFEKDGRGETFLDWIQEMICEMYGPVYSDLQQHKKHRLEEAGSVAEDLDLIAWFQICYTVSKLSLSLKVSESWMLHGVYGLGPLLSGSSDLLPPQYQWEQEFDLDWQESQQQEVKMRDQVGTI